MSVVRSIAIRPLRLREEELRRRLQVRALERRLAEALRIRANEIAAILAQRQGPDRELR